MPNNLTLVELAKRTNNGEFQLISEILSQRNRIIEDAIWVESNDFTSHKTTQRLTEPTGAYRKLNDGVTPEASETKQIVDHIGMLEGYSRIDASLVKLSKDQAAFRFGEDRAFLGGMSKTLAESILYGSLGDDVDEFDGLATRYNALADTNVVGAGGTGSDLMSMWLVKWSDFDGVHLIYPRDDSMAGISVRDLGEDTIAGVTSGTELQAFRTHFKVDVGITVRDDRSTQRYANIETAGASNIFNSDDLVTLRNNLWDLDGAVIYTNRTGLTQVDQDAKDKTNVYYTVETVFGKPTTHFQGIPIKLVEQLTITESALT